MEAPDRGIWIVTQKGEEAMAEGDEFVCASVAYDGTRVKPGRERVGEIRRGDIVVHNRKDGVKCISRVIEDARYFDELPLAGYGSGYLARVAETFSIDVPFKLGPTTIGPRLIRLHPPTGYAIDRNGKLCEGYCLRLDAEALGCILDEVSASADALPAWLRPYRRPPRPPFRPATRIRRKRGVA